MVLNSKTFGCVTTISGRKFYPLEPNPKDISIRDIAHGLSLFNRWGGHTKWPYPVSIHSVMVSFLCDQKDALIGLFHDSPEAYIGDVIQPVKYIPEIYGVYKPMETAVTQCIASVLGIPSLEKTPSVDRADKIALYYENVNLRGMSNIKCPDNITSYEAACATLWTTTEFSWRKAKDIFLERCTELGVEIN